MAYVTVPKDLSKIKTKVAFNLTKRQIVCLGAALLVGLPLFFLLKGSAGTTLAAMAMIVVMLPCFLFAMYERHGQPLEVVVKNIIQTKFTRPKERPYQTENFYARFGTGSENLKRRYRLLSKAQAQKARETAAGTKRKLFPRRTETDCRPYKTGKGRRGKRIPRSRPFPTCRCTRTGFAGLRKRNTAKALCLRILTISLHRRTTRPLSLKIGATF